MTANQIYFREFRRVLLVLRKALSVSLFWTLRVLLVGFRYSFKVRGVVVSGYDCGLFLLPLAQLLSSLLCMVEVLFLSFVNLTWSSSISEQLSE